MTDNLEVDPQYRQGEWEHTIGIDVSPIKDNVNVVEEGWHLFWSRNEVDHFVYDKNGKIIDVVRKDRPRVRPRRKNNK